MSDGIQSDDQSSFFKADVPEAKPHDSNKTKPIRKPRKHRQHREHVPRTRQNKRQGLDLKKLQFGETRAKALIQDMSSAYRRDLDLLAKGKTAPNKFMMLDRLTAELKNVYTNEKFVQLRGLQRVQLWLGSQREDEYRPSFAIRKGLLQILKFLKIKPQHLARAEELQKLVMKHKRSTSEQLRDMSEYIINKWSKQSDDE